MMPDPNSAVLDAPSTPPKTSKQPPRKPDATLAAFEISAIINEDALQAYVDGIQRDLILPNVQVGNGTYQPLEKEPREVEVHDPATGKTRKELKYQPQPACESEKDGSVILGSGVVVPPGYSQHLLKQVLPKIAQAVHRTLGVMARSHNESGGFVHDRAKVLLPVPDSDW